VIRLNLYAGVQYDDSLAAAMRRWVVYAAGAVSALVVIGLIVLIVRTMTSGPAKPVAQPAVQPAQPVAAVPQPPPKVALAEMTLPQRISYETSFSRRVLDALEGAMDAQLNATSLSIDSSAVVRLEARCAAKEPVAGLLSKIRSADITLMPKPQTQVGMAGTDYTVAMTVRALFPLDTGAFSPDSIMGRLPLPAAHTAEVKRFEQFAADAGVKIDRGLRYASALKAGALRRFVYRMDGAATLADLTKLARNLQAGRLNCAFGVVRLTPSGQGPMKMSAELYFTARE
jgi:hypothetical protein